MTQEKCLVYYGRKCLTECFVCQNLLVTKRLQNKQLGCRIRLGFAILKKQINSPAFCEPQIKRATAAELRPGPAEFQRGQSSDLTPRFHNFILMCVKSYIVWTHGTLFPSPSPKGLAQPGSLLVPWRNLAERKRNVVETNRGVGTSRLP